MSITHTVLDSHDETIRSQLAQLKDTFFAALRLGHSDLKSFSKSWKSFLALVSESSSMVETTTHSMISSFAHVVITLATTLIDAEAIHDQLEAEIASLAAVEFKKLSIRDYEPMPDPTSNATYIETCYTWLLGHLHNPYPTKAMRLRICEETGSSPQDVDAWFTSARKNIGWNELRRAHFETRFDMVKAATKFWKTPRTIHYSQYTQPAEGSKDYSYEFAQMEDRARSLYAHKFFPTSLATNLEDTVKHASATRAGQESYPPPEKAPFSDVVSSFQSTKKSRKRRNSGVESDGTYAGERPQRPLKRHRIAKPAISDANSESWPPSPTQSSYRELSLSLSPSAAPSSRAEITKPNLDAVKRKRRMSDASDCDSDSSRAPRARRKRRTNDQDDELLERPLMVGIARSRAVDPITEPPARILSSSQISQSLKRKRRLSDTMSDRPRKHPYHPANIVPRLQTVSNPYPSTAPDTPDIPEFLSTELPDITGTADLEASQNLEIESFDYAGLPGWTDYLSQMEATSVYLDSSKKMDATRVVAPEVHTFEFTESTNSSLLGLDIPISSQPFVSSYGGIFADTQTAGQSLTPVSWQFSLAGDRQVPVTTEPSPNLTVNNPCKTTVQQTSAINSFDLLLVPQAALEPLRPANLILHNPSIIPPGAMFGGASPINFALQRIQNLQAEIAVYQNHLSQCGILPC